MTKLYCDDTGRTVQVINPNYAKIQNVSFDSSTPTTTGAPHGCTMVMLIATQDCWFRSGASPTAAASATSIFLPAKVYFYHPVIEGDKVAFIKNTDAGTAQVIPAL